MAELRPKVFREPELLETVSKLLKGRFEKSVIQNSAAGQKEEPCVAEVTACSILTSALKV